MRLHRLEVTALGPFAGTETVDLDRLGADGLFLLCGDTGAGKTSVLDAIAFALFGRVPGSRQQAGRLRCDQARPDLAPMVKLELTLAGRRLRVRRSPEWRRPKRRGEGTTRQPAAAVLEERRGSEWVGLSTRIDEVSQQLLDWIGMTAEQFFQVVLLPQGEFTRFLRADSLEREALLERLFGTQRFTDVQVWLADLRGNAKLRLEKAEGEMYVWLHRLCQELGVERAEVPSAAEATRAWRAGQVHAVGETLAGAEAVVRDAEQAVAAARSAAEDARARRRLQERRILAEQERAALDAGRAADALVRDRLAAARRAAVMPPLLSAVTAAQAAVAAAGTNVEVRVRDVRAVLRDLAHDPVCAGGGGTAADIADSDSLARLADRLRAECARLTELLGRAEERKLLLADHAATETTLAELLGHAERAWVERDKLPAAVARAAERESAARSAVAALPGLHAAAERGKAALASAQAERTSAAALAEAGDQLRTAVDEHQAAVARVQDLRGRRLAGMAAELAGSLAGGQACPVCGSCEHPVPAQRALLVTEAEERAAAAAQDRAATARALIEERVQLLRTELAVHRGGRGARPADQLADEWTRLQAQVAEAQTTAAEVPERVAMTAELRRRHDALGRLLTEASGNIAEQRERAAQRRSAADRIGAVLDAARGPDRSLPARIERLDTAADGVTGLLAALATDAAARERLVSARASAEAHAVAAGFEAVDAATAAVATAAETAGWQDQVDAYARRSAALGQLLAEPGLDDPDVITSARRPAVDLEPTAGAQRAAEDQHIAAVAVLTVLRRRAAEVRRLADRLAAAEQAADPARQEYDDVRALADLVAGQGQNIRNMTLRAYVLAARLAEVAESASRRLQQMSGGRYTFQHTDLADSRRVRAGLGLVVVDDYSGLTRSTKTLSGGESFLASLALALGLADVVTAEAGGVQLETLFIDEGFGCLDADTLDQVMSTLDELRAGGRVVGVVSHVEEMRARIPSRLLVHKRRAGSTLEQISA